MNDAGELFPGVFHNGGQRRITDDVGPLRSVSIPILILIPILKPNNKPKPILNHKPKHKRKQL